MKKTLSEGTIFLTFSTLLFMVLGYGLNVWLARSLGPKDYGIYGIIIAIVTIINTIQSVGISQAVSKYIAQDNAKKDSILKSGIILQSIFTLTITLVCFFSIKYVCRLLGDPSLEKYLKISLLIIPLNGFYSLYLGYYNGLHYFKKQAFIDIIYSTSKFLFVLLLSYFYGVTGIIYGFAIAALVALFAGLHIPKINVRPFPYKLITYFSIPILGFSILTALAQSIDILFVKSILNSDYQVGYYSVSQNISKIPYFALGALSGVLLPYISSINTEKNKEETRILVSKSIKVLIMLIMPIAVLISATSLGIVNILYSSDYYNAVSSLAVLVFGVAFYTIFLVFSSILNGAGKPILSFFASVLLVTVISLLCYILIPIYGLIGASLSTTIGSFLAMIVAAYFVYRTFNMLLDLGYILKILAACSAIYLLAINLPMTLISLPFVYLFLGAVYFSILYLLKEIQEEDLQTIYKIIFLKFSFMKNGRK